MAEGWNKFIVTFALAIIGLIVFVNVMAGMYGTYNSAFTSLNNTGDTWNGSVWASHSGTIRLQSLIHGGGVLSLILMAVFVLLALIGLFGLVKEYRR